MTLYLVRHADAKSRAAWTADDRLRPLTKRGERQAAGLVDLLASSQVRRVLSSPAVRCISTVTPLASLHGIDVEEHDDLFEGAEPRAAYELLVEHATRKGDSVLCLHGDLIPELLRRAAKEGARLSGGDRWAKGSTWVLGTAHGKIIQGHYLPPPA
jgi:8-oxo-dGTP diphosphatase